MTSQNLTPEEIDKLVAENTELRSQTELQRTAEPSSGSSTFRKVLAIILAVLAILAIAASVDAIWLSDTTNAFKDVTGVSFKEYVTQVRVAEAKRLLLSTDRSVAEVADAISYTNLSQFYKVFYRSCAMSPAEYRRYYTPAGGEAVRALSR